MTRQKLTEFLTKCFCLLQLNKKSQFSKQLRAISKKLDKELKHNEILDELLTEYKVYLVAHILDLKADPKDKYFINAILNNTPIEEDEE